MVEVVGSSGFPMGFFFFLIWLFVPVGFWVFLGFCSNRFVFVFVFVCVFLRFLGLFVCVCVCLCGFLFVFVPMGFWVFKV